MIDIADFRPDARPLLTTADIPVAVWEVMPLGGKVRRLCSRQWRRYFREESLHLRSGAMWHHFIMPITSTMLGDYGLNWQITKSERFIAVWCHRGPFKRDWAKLPDAINSGSSTLLGMWEWS